MIFKKTPTQKKLNYNPAEKVPIIKCSICNREQVAGLKDLRTGKFEEIMMIRDAADLRDFEDMCGVRDIKKEY